MMPEINSIAPSCRPGPFEAAQKPLQLGANAIPPTPFLAIVRISILSSLRSMLYAEQVATRCGLDFVVVTLVVDEIHILVRGDLYGAS